MKVLICGLGSIASQHIKALKLIEEAVEIYALRSDPNAATVDGVINIFKLDDLEFDFAIISNPTQAHYEYINLLTDKGIHMMIEKPPVSSLENIAVLLKKIENIKIKTYVACNLRFHPCLVFLKNYLQNGNSKVINEVNIYCGSYLPDWRPNKDFRKIYSAIPELGGGVHLDLFHELDYTHWLFGKPLKTSSVLKNVSSLDIKAVDYANYLLEYKNFSANIILNYYRRDAKRTIEIVFQNQTILIDLIKNTVKSSGGEILFEAANYTVFQTYLDQMRYFVDYVKTNQKQMNTFADSIDVLKTCLHNE